MAVIPATSHSSEQLDASRVRPEQVWRDPATWLAALAALPVWWVIGSTGVAVFASPIDLRHWLMIGLAMPLIEELAFRGYLQPRLARLAPHLRKPFPVSRANIMTSLLFSAAHLGSGVTLAFAVFLPSLIFGALRDRHGHPWGAALVHCVYNLGLLSVCSLSVSTT